MRKPREIREAEKRLRDAGAWWSNYSGLDRLSRQRPELAADCQRLMQWLSLGR